MLGRVLRSADSGQHGLPENRLEPSDLRDKRHLLVESSHSSLLRAEAEQVQAVEQGGEGDHDADDLGGRDQTALARPRGVLPWPRSALGLTRLAAARPGHRLAQLARLPCGAPVHPLWRWRRWTWDATEPLSCGQFGELGRFGLSGC